MPKFEEVTDPELLKLLNGGADGPQPLEFTVTAQPKTEPVTDPATLAALNAPAERSLTDQVGHTGGVAARAAAQGTVGGFLAPSALAVDAARNLAYGGKLALAKTGLVDAPDPKNYYDGRDTYFPTLAMTNEAAAAIPNAMGLPQPETRAERIGSAVVEGVSGGLSGVGLGRGLVKFGPRVAREAGEWIATNPVRQAIAGGTGGAAAQTAVEAGANEKGAVGAGVIGGLLPMVTHMRGTGRVTSTTEPGQRAIAGSVLREISRDPDAAIQNLEGAGNTAVPGFQHLSSNAARDPGIAAISPKLRDWAKLHNSGGVMDIEHNNSTILSNALDSLGATGGTAEATRRLTRGAGDTRLAAMDLANLPNVDITPVLHDLERASDLRNRGVSAASADTARDIRQRILDSARPVMSIGADGIPRPTGRYNINPERLHSVRVDINSGMRPTGPTIAGVPGTVRYEKGIARQFRGQIDDMLNQHTLGDYADYLREYRQGMGQADQQAFMGDFAGVVSPSGRVLEGGARDIDKNAFLRRMSEAKEDRPIPGGTKSMSVERLQRLGDDPRNLVTTPRPGQVGPPDPGARIRYGFLQRAQRDINDASYSSQAGNRATGSNTSFNADVSDMVASRVHENLGPVRRVASALMPVAEAGTNAVTRMGGPAGSFGIRAAVKGVGNLLTTGRDRATENVQRLLGAAELDPAEMAALMRTPALQRPSMVGIGGRATVRGTRYGLQGFLEGERTARYR